MVQVSVHRLFMLRFRIRISPALGTRVGYAAALAEVNGAEQGLAVLDAID